jgi:hypothetical protein
LVHRRPWDQHRCHEGQADINLAAPDHCWNAALADIALEFYIVNVSEPCTNPPLIRFIHSGRRTTVETQRRQVTVLFTDMVGFTAFSEAAGEEAAFRLMQHVARLTGEVVREYGGAVQNFTGDGLMAVFGAPVAYEAVRIHSGRANARKVLSVFIMWEEIQWCFRANPR